MSTVPPPISSPIPPDPGPEESSKVTRLGNQTEWLRNAFIAGLALLFGAGGGLAWKVLDKFDLVNAATAQTKATADQALEASKQNAVRIENVDAGTARAVENLRREVAEARAETDRKLDRILAEVKKR